MTNRALFFALAAMAVTIGCGGGGGANGGPPPPGGGGVPGALPGDSEVMANLPNTSTGRVNIAYLPRQGRAADSTTAVIRQFVLSEGPNLFTEFVSSDIVFPLGGSEVQSRSAIVPMLLDNPRARIFDTYVLPIERVVYDPSSTEADDETTFTSPTDEPLIREVFPLSMRVFPARETTLEIRLNDAMVVVQTDPDTGSALDVQFDRVQFELQNMQGGPNLISFVSDMIAFDIQPMGGSRPQMSNGDFADRVYFSGDRFALSQAGPSGYFEMLTKDSLAPQPGEFVDPIPLGGTAAPGEYRTITGDPNDPSPDPAQITALRGPIRPYFSQLFPSISVVTNPSDFDVVMLPTSGAPDVMQILLVARNGLNQATNFYYGEANLTTATFEAYPLANLPTGVTDNSISGTLSGFLDGAALSVSVVAPADGDRVRYGRYAIGGSLPSGFEASGRFIVIRR